MTTKLAAIQLWNDKKHGNTSLLEDSESPRGHFLNIHYLSLEEFRHIRWKPDAVGKDWYYPGSKVTVQIIKPYRKGDFYLALPVTFYLRIFQRRWRRNRRNNHEG